MLRTKALALFLTVSAHAAPTVDQVLHQDQAQNGGNIGFVAEPTAQETKELWHLSEGSDFFPLKWFYTMESAYSNQPGTKLYQNLDQKFNLLPDREHQGEFALPWVGLSASWAGTGPRAEDLTLSPGETLREAIDKPQHAGQVAVVGINCAFCHTGQIQFSERKLTIQGAPAMIDLRSFYVDMFDATAMTMLDQDVLERFLRANAVDSPLKTAKNYVASLKHELGLDGNVITNLALKVAGFVDPAYVQGLTQPTVQKALFTHREVFISYLERLAQLSLKLDELAPEIKARLRYLGTMITSDPDLPSTLESYSSIDAFGRIANMLARRKQPGPVTAVTSFPPIWGVQYQAQFHWNANTNSVIMRNIGQAFGLGAVFVTPDAHGPERYDSTVNIENLAKLEKSVYKIGFPDWRDTGESVDLARVRRGCTLYQSTCAQCHTSDKARVGPQKLLLNPFLPKRELVKTDETYLRNQAEPVEGVPFKTALFSLIGFVRDQYYARNATPPAQQAEWEHKDLRGIEIFRDTSLGENAYAGDLAYMNAPLGVGYGAQSLAGVWATPPYLHNGSVPNLYELLQPARFRSKTFFLGTREYDTQNLGYYSGYEDNVDNLDLVDEKARELMQPNPGLLTRIFGHVDPQPANLYEAKIQAACAAYPEHCYRTDQPGNSNAGHEFGTDLSDDDKYALIEFIKVLRPPVEYSSNRPPIYGWDGQKCETY